MSERAGLLDGGHAPEAALRALVGQLCDWYWETDAQLRVTLVQGAAPAADAAPPHDWLGRHAWDLPGELLQPANRDEHRRCLQQRLPFATLAVRRVRDDGSVAVAQLSGTPAFDAGGAFLGYVGTARDVSAEYRARDAVQRFATTDALTGLLNRQAFDTHAGRLLKEAYARGGQCVLLNIGLDRFAYINSVHGHTVGDRMLVAIAERLQRQILAPNLLGRGSGDEIVALLVDIAAGTDVDATAAAVMAAVAPPVVVGTLPFTVQASVGAAVFPSDGGDLDALLNAADAALQLAKHAGAGAPARITPELARRTDLRMRLEQRLRDDLAAREFRLFYQPLVDMASGELVGAEALLRWQDAELGDISPAEFIPIAEQCGLIEGIGEWVLREACRQRQLWRQIGLDMPPVAINVSGVQLRDPAFVDRLLATLDAFSVDAAEIEIEITETGLLESPATAGRSLQRLHNAGVKAALDDFGVGYSSLSHLRDLPMHRLKIDRSFTVDCMRDARTLTIVKAVIDMAHNLGLHVTAEGIETAEQRAWMQHLGCDSAQGYYFARPLPAEEFLQRFLERRAQQTEPKAAVSGGKNTP